MLQDRTRTAWLRRWLAPPVFEGDAERTRRAELLNAIVLGLLAVLAAYCVVRLFMLDINWSFLSIAGAIALLELVVWSLMRNGQVQWASLIQVGALWLVISMVNYIAGGVQASGSVVYALLIVMAGQLLGWQGGVLFLGLGLASELYFVYAEGAGTLPPLQADVTPLDTWMVHAVALAMMGLLLSMSNRRLVGALERVSRNERQWMESNLELQAARTALEQRDAYLRAKTQQYVEYAMAVGTGDLTLRLDVQDDEHEGTAEYDPLVVLGHQLNDMVTALQYMIGQIREAANNLGTAATEILAATTEQASGAAEQSAAIAQTTSTVDEVRTISEQATLRAQEVAGSSRRTVEVANTGQQAVQDTIESMYDIRDRVEGIAENILSLSEQTQQIGEIIATVSEIAAQSNMLALNASVEAARAGEAGRGFAVVAAEVRNLAEQSRQATVQVKAILSEIQRATNATVMATEEGSKGVDKGVHLAVQAQASIEELAGVINESAQAAAQMVAGGQQQAGGIGQIALAMQSINQATVQSLSSTRQAEKAARDLNELARGLTAVVEEYKLS